MVALPATAPPPWASNALYTLGPDTGTVTKVDSTSVAPNGHVPGKDFPSTAQEMNSWMSEAADVLRWDFDSITAAPTTAGTNDPRVLSTDGLGAVTATSFTALGSSVAVAPALRALQAPAGAPTAEFTAADGDGGLLITPTGSGTTGPAIRLEVGSTGTMSGLLVETNDPHAPSIDVTVLGGSANTGNGIGISTQGGPGDQSNRAGTGLVAIGGAGGGAGGGFAIEAFAVSPDAHVFVGVGSVVAIAGDTVVKALAFADGDCFDASCAGGHAARLESTGGATQGAPLLLAPQFAEPASSMREQGTTWIDWDAGQDMFQPRMELSTNNTRPRFLLTRKQQPVRLFAFKTSTSVPNGSGAATKIINAASFPDGAKPYNQPIFAIATFSCIVERSSGADITFRDQNAGNLRMVNNTTAAEIFNEVIALPPGFFPVGGELPGDPLTWGDRNESACRQHIYIRRSFTITNNGVGSFTVDAWRNDAVTSTLLISDAILTIETLE